jgi:hypothetical protein
MEIGNEELYQIILDYIANELDKILEDYNYTY